MRVSTIVYDTLLDVVRDIVDNVEMYVDGSNEDYETYLDLISYNADTLFKWVEQERERINDTKRSEEIGGR